MIDILICKKTENKINKQSFEGIFVISYKYCYIRIIWVLFNQEAR